MNNTMREEGVGVEILNGCCHNNLECRKICRVGEEEDCSMFDSSEIDWFFRDFVYIIFEGF